MFGKKAQESNLPENPETQEKSFSEPTTFDLDNQLGEDNIEIFSSEFQPTTVNVVEKISEIISPYFIVVVGLFLYDDNFFLGISLIAVGILSLLKISLKDIGELINTLKKSLGLNK